MFNFRSFFGAFILFLIIMTVFHCYLIYKKNNEEIEERDGEYRNNSNFNVYHRLQMGK